MTIQVAMRVISLIINGGDVENTIKKLWKLVVVGHIYYGRELIVAKYFCISVNQLCKVVDPLLFL
jgi:hypothetical protein